MAYIGRGTDKLSNIEKLDVITFDGSSSYTLQKNSVNFTPNSANSLQVSIDGVVQAGNFTVSGSTIDFGVAIPATSTCDFIFHYGTGLITTPADGTVDAGTLSTDAITGQTEDTTPADDDLILTYDTSASALKKVQKSNLATAPDVIKLASGSVSSAVATVSIDGYYTSDYNSYKLILQNIDTSTTSGNNLKMRFNQSGSALTASNYAWSNFYSAVTSASSTASANQGSWSSDHLKVTSDLNTTDSQSGFAEIILYDPLSTTRYKHFNGLSSNIYQNGNGRWTQYLGGHYRGSTGAMSGVTLFLASGNITGLDWKLYGYK